MKFIKDCHKTPITSAFYEILSVCVFSQKKIKITSISSPCTPGSHLDHTGSASPWIAPATGSQALRTWFVFRQNLTEFAPVFAPSRQIKGDRTRTQGLTHCASAAAQDCPVARFSACHALSAIVPPVQFVSRIAGMRRPRPNKSASHPRPSPPVSICDRIAAA